MNIVLQLYKEDHFVLITEELSVWCPACDSNMDPFG